MAIVFKRKIGTGVYADVWLADDTELKRLVAAKIIRPSDAFGKQTLAHAQVLTQLDHPSIVKVFSIATVEDPESPGVQVEAILMEFVDASTLAERTAAGQIGLPETRRIGATLIDVVGYMEARGMPNGDLHESNVLVNDEKVVVIDVAYLSGTLSSVSRDARVLRDRRSLQHLIEGMLERCDDSASRVAAFRDAIRVDASYAGVRAALDNASRDTVAPTVRTAIAPVVSSTRTVMLDDGSWFQTNSTNAESGIGKLGLSGLVEFRFAVDQKLDKTPNELREAVRRADRSSATGAFDILRLDRGRLRPTEQGIVSEISVENGGVRGHSAYDYWALRVNGDFFLLQGLIEDHSVDNTLWFDASIARVASGLLFAKALYSDLGASAESTLSARIAHRGLAGRTLRSAQMSVDLFDDHQTGEYQSQREIRVSLGALDGDFTESVKRIVVPMFELFNFASFTDNVYIEAIRRVRPF